MVAAEESCKSAQGDRKKGHQKKADDDHLTEKLVSGTFFSGCLVETAVTSVCGALRNKEDVYK